MNNEEQPQIKSKHPIIIAVISAAVIALAVLLILALRIQTVPSVTLEAGEKPELKSFF